MGTEAWGVDTGRSGQLEPRTPPRSLPELAHAAPSGAIWGPRLGWGEVGWWEDKVSACPQGQGTCGEDEL